MGSYCLARAVDRPLLHLGKIGKGRGVCTQAIILLMVLYNDWTAPPLEQDLEWTGRISISISVLFQHIILKYTIQKKVNELYFPEIKYLSFYVQGAGRLSLDCLCMLSYCLIYYAAKHKRLAV